jgi:hypothetical protein
MASKRANNQIPPYCGWCGEYVSHVRTGNAVRFIGGTRVGHDLICHSCDRMERAGHLVRI